MPTSAHHFVPVWPSLETEKSHRSKEYGPSRKRKRQPDQEDSDDEDTYSQTTTPSRVGSRSRVNTVRLEEGEDPHQVAGHSRNLPLPSYPFPHAPLKQPRRDATAETVQKSLAALRPPLYVPPVTEREDARTSLRRHHLSVMTTIMHTSLLRGDYVRAGRAWGMILRSEFLGRSTDVRTHGRWGIGAEILLRQHTERPDKPSPESEGNDDLAAIRETTNEISFTNEGFQLASEYYRRLILQYPYQKTNPHLINDLNFLPAMYGLQVYQIQQKYKQEVKAMERDSVSPPPYGVEETSDRSDKDDRQSSDGKLLDIKTVIVDMAIELAGRIDELMLSPPYNAHAPLLQFRAMVSLWIVDLVKDMVLLSGKVDTKYDTRLAKETERSRKFVDDLKHRGEELPELFHLAD